MQMKRCSVTCRHPYHLCCRHHVTFAKCSEYHSVKAQTGPTLPAQSGSGCGLVVGELQLYAVFVERNHPVRCIAVESRFLDPRPRGHSSHHGVGSTGWLARSDQSSGDANLPTASWRRRNGSPYERLPDLSKAWSPSTSSMFPFSHGSGCMSSSQEAQGWTISQWCSRGGVRKLTGMACERPRTANAILLIGSLPGFRGGARRESTESATGRADRPWSRVWGVHRAMLSSYQMRPASRDIRIRSFSLGIGDIRMAQAIKFVVGQGLLTLAGLSAARQVSSWIRIATQRGMLVVMPRDEDLEDPAENEFFQD